MRDLAFNGAPLKEMVPILPCGECLVSVADKPVRARRGSRAGVACWTAGAGSPSASLARSH
jgi:hypothetical protein